MASGVRPALVSVDRALDGDTLAAHAQGKRFKIRLAALDNPECRHPGRSADPAGHLCRVALDALARRSWRELWQDPLQPRLDAYGRRLGYLIDPATHADTGALLIAQGFAWAAPWHRAFALPWYAPATAKAIREQRGLWSPLMPIPRGPAADRILARHAVLASAGKSESQEPSHQEQQ